MLAPRAQHSAVDAAPPVACSATADASARGVGVGGAVCGPAQCPRCTAFLLLHKCASTTILHVLRAPIWRTVDHPQPNTRTRCGGTYYCDWMAYATSGCLARSRRPHELSDHDAWLYFGGYLPAISPRVARHGCRTFALLREPIARLLSARSYCARGGKGRPAFEGGDVLCGNRSSGSVAQWAQHWGAYLFRQLALAPSVYKQLATDGRLPAPAAPDCSFPEQCSPVLQRATFSWVEQRAAFGRNDDGTSTRAGRAALRALSAQMSAGRLFDVVAIYEEWNASMALLDVTLPLAGGRTWAEQSRTRKTNVG